MTEELVRFVNTRLRRDLTPIFDQYCARPSVPVLELALQRGGADDGLPVEG